jgi:hypothetical protein
VTEPTQPDLFGNLDANLLEPCDRLVPDGRDGWREGDWWRPMENIKVTGDRL